MPSIHAPDYQGPHVDKFDASWAEIKRVVEGIRASLKDGFQVADIGTWHPLVVEAYDTAKTIYGEDFGKQELTHLVTYIYWAINPNWPWIPETVEKRLEKVFIENLAIPLAVGAAWDAVAGFIASRTGRASADGDSGGAGASRAAAVVSAEVAGEAIASEAAGEV